jgi:hypothetical protein
MGQGLAAIADNVKKRKEAEQAASGGVTPPVAGLAAAKPKPKPAPKPAPVAAQSTNELAKRVDAVTAGTVDETDAVIAKQREAMKRK